MRRLLTILFILLSFTSIAQVVNSGFDVKINTTSKLRISPNLTPGVISGVTDVTINNNYYLIQTTKFIVSSTDPDVPRC